MLHLTTCKLCDFRQVRRLLTRVASVANAFVLVVGWITATHFLGISPSSNYVNYNVSKIVQPELYQTPVDTPVYLLC